MDGSSVAPVVIPILVVISLVAWLTGAAAWKFRVERDG
jgi:hypothetical protein